MFKLRIWDLPTRLFHWALVVCVVGLVITGNVGGNAMVWHFRLGYAVLTLLVFRGVWGFVGGHWSRWAQMSWRPGQVWAYLQGQLSPQKLAGHNPLGAWSIVAMLFFLGFQVATGLISDDEIANAGPLTTWVSGAWVSWATSWHKQWGKLAVLALVVVHLAALAWYRYAKHQALVPAMLHGHKTLTVEVPESKDQRPQRVLALVVVLMAALAVATLVSWGA